jgi:hypothetical protein
MKPWRVARLLANNISIDSAEPADWLEDNGCAIKWSYPALFALLFIIDFSSTAQAARGAP